MHASQEPRFRKAGLAALLLVLMPPLLAGLALPAAARVRSDRERYEACVNRSGRAPRRALEEALEWRDRGGGVAAHHCAALALVELRRYGEAAARLEDIADEIASGVPPGGGGPRGGGAVGPGPAMHAAILAQAGNAWLLAGEAGKAYPAFSDALGEVEASSRQEVELRIDRARALAGTGDYEGAVDDLTRAAQIAPLNADVFIYRASARRALDLLDLARRDVETALDISPGNVYALLERGNLLRLEGDDDGARADWSKILAEAPGTPVADVALANIRRLEFTGAGEADDRTWPDDALSIPPLLLDPAPRSDNARED